ncbi:hypothetical protein GCM10028805_02170 [Spirosoma harenae]
MPPIDLTTFLSMALLLYAWWPGYAGRNRWTGRLVSLVLLSPVLRYLSALFTFPIRLQLSAGAGYLLRLFGIPVHVEGNVISRIMSSANPVDMAVDPACMGLQLTGVSLLVGLFSLIWQERLQRKKLPMPWIIAFESIVFGLTILCNLFRIVLLVLFGAMPETLTHELIGLACVFVYTWVPAWGLAILFIRRLGQPELTNPSTGTMTKMVQSAGWGLGVILIGISVRAFAALPEKSASDLSIILKKNDRTWANYRLGCTSDMLPNGFIKLVKPGLLLYIKPQLDWFSADHSPVVCWKGSGYELKRIQETTLDGHPTYVGELHKKGRVLYTAWWFSNGACATISQLTMRKKIIQGETGFALINITSDKPFTSMRLISAKSRN